MIRIVLLFLPSLCGLIWKNDPWTSILWSLGGSLFIAIVSQTPWFAQNKDKVSITYRLLRPAFMFQLFFVLLHVVGGACYVMNGVGISFSKDPAGNPEVFDLFRTATAQALMLLGQAGITAGMALGSWNYRPPDYRVRDLPRYSLLVLSLICIGVAAVVGEFSSLRNLGEKLLQISFTAILVETTFAVAARDTRTLLISLVPLLSNLMAQILSGWKGLVLWSAINLGAMLYPLMPRRVICGGIGIALFWVLVLHPFGIALRPLIWSDNIDSDTASAIAKEKTVNMSFDERIDNAWIMLVERANELYQFERYLEYVPDIHPYFGIEIAEESLFALIPRIVWPEKPDLERIAMVRVVNAGIVSSDTEVSVKANFYQDAYLSWGWHGVLIASLVFGFIISCVYQLAERLFGGYEMGTCLIFTSLFGSVVRNPPDFVFFVGTTWSSFLVMIAVFMIGKATGWIVPATASRGFLAKRGQTQQTQPIISQPN